jgi:hypothetical protein
MTIGPERHGDMAVLRLNRPEHRHAVVDAHAPVPADPPPVP